MATIPTPLLQDQTLASLSVTELFHGGTSYIQRAKANIINSDTAVIDELTVNNLVVNGTVSGASSEPVDLGLSPNQLVVTNASSTPVSFPYGTSANDMAIRDGSGAISFTKWTTPETNQTQLTLYTGASTTLSVDLNSTADTTVTLADAGDNANIVTYSSGQSTKNVMASGDNNIHLQSTGGEAGVRIQTDDVANALISYDLAANGTTGAKMYTNVDVKAFNITTGASAPRLLIVPTGDGTSNISFNGAVRPATTAEWGLSNGNENSFSHLFLSVGAATSPNFTDPVSSNFALARITLNSGNADTIAPMASKDCTYTNPFITATSKFVVTLQSAGTLNTPTVGMPYVYVKAATTGSCTLRTQNLSSPLFENDTLSTAIIVAVLILP